MIGTGAIPQSGVAWNDARRIVRSLFPPVDVFEDIADPADWPLLISAARKTDPRLMASIGNIDLVPASRRVSGPGATWLMAPFTHASTDRPGRFGDGVLGVLYIGDSYEVALFETMHHHARFMARTREAAGWTSQFLEIILDVRARLHDLRGGDGAFAQALDPADHAAAQSLGARLRGARSDGVVYPSLRRPGGECVGLFHPDSASNPVAGRHLDYHWDGLRVDLVREARSGAVFRVV